MPRQRSQLERRCSRSAAVVVLLLAGYVLGGPIIHSAVSRRFPGQQITRVLYAPLFVYAYGTTRYAGADWYRSYWVMCGNQVRKYV
jgi:hypothetical protein